MKEKQIYVYDRWSTISTCIDLFSVLEGLQVTFQKVARKSHCGCHQRELIRLNNVPGRELIAFVMWCRCESWNSWLRYVWWHYLTCYVRKISFAWYVVSSQKNLRYDIMPLFRLRIAVIDLTSFLCCRHTQYFVGSRLILEMWTLLL